MSEESKTFIECKKAINRLLREERRLERQLKKIQQEKMLCIRVLYDNEYCKEVLGDKENE